MRILLRIFQVGVLILQFAMPQPAQAAPASLTVYGNTLASGWQDWSWGGQTHNFNNASPVHSASASIQVQFSAGWAGFQLGTDTPPTTGAYNALEFWIHGGSSGGQLIRVMVGNDCTSVSLDLTLAAGAWSKVTLPLTGLDNPAPIKFIYWFTATDHAQPAFYLDDVALVSGPVALPPQQAAAGPALSVDAQSGRHAISPLIYGMNFAPESLAAELRLPLNRWGGNSTTRYNYLNDTHNTGLDWYFENITNDNPDPSHLPNSSSADRFVAQNRRTATQTLLTVPLIGWTPKSRQFACGFSTALYGPQQATDPYAPTCGKGVRPNDTLITGSPGDTSTAIGPDFVQGWMAHLAAQFGPSTQGGVRFYDLDNEPMLWNSTHRDVHPLPVSYDELRNRTIAYAAAIKAADPGARTLGPVLWGWTAYFYSALDAASGGEWWNNPLDRLAHGNLPFVTWYLQQLNAYQQQHGLRLLDYLDLHIYPQREGIFSSSAGDAATQAARLRSTRSLWDPSYVDESWINEPVMLIPRMHEWVDQNYPGTKLAVSEYSWGAQCHISGALAQADVLGIFGREGLDLATLWDPPTATQPGAFAFRMFRNVDGQGGAFGETSLQAASAAGDSLSIFAAQRSRDGALTVLVINKTGAPLTSTLTLSGFTPAASASGYRYGSGALAAIPALPPQPLSSSGFEATFPAQSITLYVIPTGGGWYHAYVPVAVMP